MIIEILSHINEDETFSCRLCFENRFKNLGGCPNILELNYLSRNEFGSFILYKDTVYKFPVFMIRYSPNKEILDVILFSETTRVNLDIGEEKIKKINIVHEDWLESLDRVPDVEFKNIVKSEL